MILLLRCCLGCMIGLGLSQLALAQLSFTATTQLVLPKIVKIYGAGGIRGLEAYQSGILISAEGHVLTVFSYVLDTDSITVTLHDGSRYEAEQLGSDPRLEIAVLKIDADQLDHFDLAGAAELSAGNRVLAFSNLYLIATGNEPASVQHGHVAAVWQLAARRGTFQTPYDGRVYIVDAMTNNPGAAGGALTNLSGQLAGMLGKELRSSESNTWLNYAIPVAELSDSVNQIRAGNARVTSLPNETTRIVEPWTARLMGIHLIPDLMPKTPPFIESIVPESPAATAGLMADDLVVYVNQQVVRSQQQLIAALQLMDSGDKLSIVVLRDNELQPVTIVPRR